MGREIALDKVHRRRLPGARREPGLTPNPLVDPATGAIDYTRASWSRASWSDAADPLRASWSRASWSRASWSRASWSATPESCSDFERASWCTGQLVVRGHLGRQAGVHRDGPDSRELELGRADTGKLVDFLQHGVLGRRQMARPLALCSMRCRARGPKK